jgi:hypothetical protein
VNAQAARKRLGAWYTPPQLVDVVVDGVLRDFDDGRDARRVVEVIDPACGDGRFLTAVADRLMARDPHLDLHLVGCDVDPTSLDAIDDDRVERVHADALHHEWGTTRFDIVVGNPPFLSQMAAATTRGGSSLHGGGPYADVAAEFLALGVRLARPGGVIGLILPQSILASRDAAPVRADVARRAARTWSWWEPDQRHFDAEVNVCALGFRSRAGTGDASDDASDDVADGSPWTDVVTGRLGVPHVDPGRLASDGTIGDRAHLNANFRDEYYALVPAVADDVDGPPLVTSGLIDPGRCWWGHRPVRFAKQRFEHPRVDLGILSGRFAAWAERKLVPKVLVANQTKVIEAVADPSGAWLPGVPVTTVTPTVTDVDAEPDVIVWRLAAVLTSPVASALAWQLGAGTGLSTTAVRIGPRVLAAIPWPGRPLDDAVAALRDGDVPSCGRAVTRAYGIVDRDDLLDWWIARLPR